jgi:alpha,alpha-trehalose phosphorylase
MTARHARVDERLLERLAGSSGWKIAEHRHDAEAAGTRESLFAVGNGYLGLRGTPEEGGAAHDAGAILNGFHETWPIVYPEDAFGLARTGQTIVSATDGSVMRLFVDDEPFDLATARVLRFERVLDMRTGVLRREVEFATPSGRRMLVRSRRLASLEDRHLAAFDYEVVALDAGVRIAISSELVTHGAADGGDDPRRGKGFAEKVLEPIAAHALDRRAILWLGTRSSGLEMACGMDHEVEAPSPVTVETTAEGDGAAVVVHTELAAGEALRVRKYVAYHWAAAAPAGDLAARAGRTLDRARRAGYERVELAHASRVADFWRRSDIQLDGAPELQAAIRFNLFSFSRPPPAGRASACRPRA